MTKCRDSTSQQERSERDGYAADHDNLERVSLFVSGTLTGGEADTGVATAYRTMVQTIADHQNAVPSPKWPPYVIGVGASLFGTGSTLLYLSNARTFSEFVGPIVLYLSGAFLIGWGLWSLRAADELRRRAYFTGRMLFNQWAAGANQPHEDVTLGPAKRDIEKRLAQGYTGPKDENSTS